MTTEYEKYSVGTCVYHVHKRKVGKIIGYGNGRTRPTEGPLYLDIDTDDVYYWVPFEVEIITEKQYLAGILKM